MQSKGNRKYRIALIGMGIIAFFSLLSIIVFRNNPMGCAAVIGSVGTALSAFVIPIIVGFNSEYKYHGGNKNE